MSTQVAKTILEQLGGNRFAYMTGARSFSTYGERGLMFSLPSNRPGPNRVTIELLPSDTYRMTFQRITARNGKYSRKVTAQFEDVYCDQLRPLFREATGLETRL